MQKFLAVLSQIKYKKMVFFFSQLHELCIEHNFDTILTNKIFLEDTV